jgi:hypothetical protein
MRFLATKKLDDRAFESAIVSIKQLFLLLRTEKQWVKK